VSKWTTLEDLLKQIDHDAANPLVKWDAKTKTIDIISGDHQYTWDRPYYIDIDRIVTHAYLVGWLAHLLEKEWFTTRHAEELIRVWANVTGNRLHFGN
jgi:hypothetical protein